ncbi:MAG: hypothetical protein PHN74_01340 [Candidatus Pacebacteria bacterium]|nr:hypothetical protein [Candidatus Paceibacterota bacterium]
MHEPRKINVGKDEEIAVVIEKIIDADCQEITLIIPRFSHFGESASNFRLLKREADILNKKVLVETVDNKSIEYAKASGLEAINPFMPEFSKEADREEPETKKFKKKNKKEAKREPIEIKPIIEIEEEKEEEEEEDDDEDENESENREGFFMSTVRTVLKLITAVLVLGVVYFLAFRVLPHAEIKLLTAKTSWAYNNSVIVEKVARTGSSEVAIPGQTFTQKKNFEIKAQATGKKQVENKAKGKIIVYNGYSTKAQPLIKETRFASPEGKIFFSVKSVTVPGADIVEGKIVPSSLEIDVVAEKAGVDYNIGPAKLFTIPGFKGTAKYQAFYGESKEAMSGGFVGEVSYPTAADIKSAKDKLSQMLESELKTEVYSQIPPDFKILDGAVNFSVLNQTVKEEADKDNNFSVFEEAQMTAIVFKEEDLKSLLIERALKEKGQEYEIKESSLEYGLVRGDFAAGRMSFPVDFKSVLRKKIDVEQLREKIVGQSQAKLKEAILSLPGLENMTINLWPVWVSKVPLNEKKIDITID